MSNTSGASYTLSYPEYIVLSGMEEGAGVAPSATLGLTKGTGFAACTMTAVAIAAILTTSGTPTMAQNPILDQLSGFSVTLDHTMRVSENERLQAKFTALATKWRDETGMISSTLKIVMHPAYQSIMAMGEKALPFILRDLQQEPDHWFYALRMITDDSPVKPEDAGDMQKMADSWVQWGIESGYIV